jgi:hypothetical protein
VGSDGNVPLCSGENGAVPVIQDVTLVSRLKILIFMISDGVI